MSQESPHTIDEHIVRLERHIDDGVFSGFVITSMVESHYAIAMALAGSERRRLRRASVLNKRAFDTWYRFGMGLPRTQFPMRKFTNEMREVAISRSRRAIRAAHLAFNESENQSSGWFSSLRAQHRMFNEWKTK